MFKADCTSGCLLRQEIEAIPRPCSVGERMDERMRHARFKWWRASFIVECDYNR
jgi:hypothetical protein